MINKFADDTNLSGNIKLPVRLEEKDAMQRNLDGIER